MASKYARLGLGEASKTTVILAPLILFLFLSGKISELEGLGWKAKFSNVRTQDVIKAARSSDLATISEQTDPGDFRNEANWGSMPALLPADRELGKKQGEAG